MPPRKQSMTDEHKKALARGREQGRAVRDYLEWLEWSRPTRGRKRDASPERIAEVKAQIAEAESPLQRLQLVQLRRDLEAEAETEDDPREAERIYKALHQGCRALFTNQGHQLRGLARTRRAGRRTARGGGDARGSLTIRPQPQSRSRADASRSPIGRRPAGHALVCHSTRSSGWSSIGASGVGCTEPDRRDQRGVVRRRCTGRSRQQQSGWLLHGSAIAPCSTRQPHSAQATSISSSCTRRGGTTLTRLDGSRRGSR